MHLAELVVHPVKSLRGHRPEGVEVEPHGLAQDRRWMLVDAHGDKVRPERFPQLLAVRARPRDDGGVALTAPGRDPLVVAAPHDGARTPVSLSRVGWAHVADDAANRWLTAALGRPVRLVWLDDPGRRSVAPAHGGRPGEALSLADAGPVLLTSMASLRRLDAWVAQRWAERYAACPREAGDRPHGVAMERFRPNLVVDGDLEPFVEDRWAEVRVGQVRFRVSEPCDRCAVPGIDPRTQQVTAEPLRTLARHRRRDGLTWFGVRMVPVTTGRLHVGDPVVATERS